MNQVVLVGKIANDIEKDKMQSYLVVVVKRPFKNEDGEYEEDLINCLLEGGLLKNAVDYCKKGDVVGVKGKLQNIDNQTTVIAEKITFLSTKQNDDEVEDGRKEEN